MEDFAVIKYRFIGKRVAKEKEAAFAKGIREDLEAYKYEYDFLRGQGYTLEHYTPKVKEVVDISISIGDDGVCLLFKPKGLEKDEDVRRLLLYLVNNNINNF